MAGNKENPIDLTGSENPFANNPYTPFLEPPTINWESNEDVDDVTDANYNGETQPCTPQTMEDPQDPPPLRRCGGCDGIAIAHDGDTIYKFPSHLRFQAEGLMNRVERIQQDENTRGVIIVELEASLSSIGDEVREYWEDTTGPARWVKRTAKEQFLYHVIQKGWTYETVTLDYGNHMMLIAMCTRYYQRSMNRILVHPHSGQRTWNGLAKYI